MKERQSAQVMRGCGFLTFGFWPAMARKKLVLTTLIIHGKNRRINER